MISVFKCIRYPWFRLFILKSRMHAEYLCHVTILFVSLAFFICPTWHVPDFIFFVLKREKYPLTSAEPWISDAFKYRNHILVVDCLSLIDIYNGVPFGKKCKDFIFFVLKREKYPLTSELGVNYIYYWTCRSEKCSN
jgi:hypothetical protein